MYSANAPTPMRTINVTSSRPSTSGMAAISQLFAVHTGLFPWVYRGAQHTTPSTTRSRGKLCETFRVDPERGNQTDRDDTRDEQVPDFHRYLSCPLPGSVSRNQPRYPPSLPSRS